VTVEVTVMATVTVSVHGVGDVTAVGDLRPRDGQRVWLARVGEALVVSDEPRDGAVAYAWRERPGWRFADAVIAAIRYHDVVRAFQTVPYGTVPHGTVPHGTVPHGTVPYGPTSV
jgi:hypothetical protein